MRYLFNEKTRPILQRLANERALCAFDFDGTLAPIVEHPDTAVMRDSTRDLLARVAAIYPTVVISGRARADVLSKLQGVAVEQVLGSHGAEAGAMPPESRERVQGWISAIESALGEAPGIWVEDKGLSLAVHYRQYPKKAEARRRIHRATKDLEGAHVFGGKEVVNIVEAGAPHKGTALAAARDRLGCDWVLFIGDDDNDEQAFALPGNTVPVRVGKNKRSCARYYLRAQREIERLLEALIEAREQAAS